MGYLTSNTWIIIMSFQTTFLLVKIQSVQILQ